LNRPLAEKNESLQSSGCWLKDEGCGCGLAFARFSFKVCAWVGPLGMSKMGGAWDCDKSNPGVGVGYRM